MKSWIEKARTIARSVWNWARQHPKLAIPASLVVLILGGLIIRSVTKSGPTLLSYYTVKRGDFLISIVEGGTLKAVKEVTVRCDMEGITRILSIVPEGTYAKKGDLLVELDASDLKDRVAGQEVVYQTTLFNYLQGKENLTIQKSLMESNIKDYELRLEFARSDLEKYVEGEKPQTEKKLRTAITLAEEDSKRSKDRLNWTVELHKRGYATKSELEADTLALTRNDITLEQAQEDLRLFLKYTGPKEKRRLEALVDSADKEFDRTKLRSAGNIAQYEADLTTRKNTLDLQETRLTALKEQLKLAKIYAPSDGLVVYASSSSPGSGILIEEGATVRQKQDLIKLPDISQMTVEIRVHESHVQKIKPGLRAFVTIDSLPDQQFRGEVHKVAVLPDAASRYYNPNLKVYATEVQIEDEIPDLKPGVSGRAEVIITNLTQVLTVPIQAVTTVKGRQVCFLEKGSTHFAVPVEVGLYNDRYIEIKKGLQEGDRVLLASASEGDNMDLGGSIIGEDSEGTNKALLKNGDTDNGSKTAKPEDRKAEAKTPQIDAGKKSTAETISKLASPPFPLNQGVEVARHESKP